MEVGTEMKSVM